MPKIVSSPLALRLVIALGQAPDGRRASELAEALGAPFTSVARALDLVRQDGVVARLERRYTLVGSPQADAVTRLAIAFMEPADLLTAASRTNRAVEFCGFDDQGYVIVVRRFADPADEDVLRSFVGHLKEVHDVEVELLDKGVLRDRLVLDDAPRRRARRLHIVRGSVERSFPDRSLHGDPTARPLGRLHPSLSVPSQRRLRALVRRYHLRRIAAFGSATRTDFRPGSDVDLLVEPREGHRPRLGELVRLNSEVEELFGHDVDLLSGPVPPGLGSRIDRDTVVLYDAGR